MKLHQTRLVKPLSPIQCYLREHSPEAEKQVLKWAKSDRQLLQNQVDNLQKQLFSLQDRKTLLEQALQDRNTTIKANIQTIIELQQQQEESSKRMQERAYAMIQKAQSSVRQLETLLNFMDEKKLQRALIRIKQALHFESGRDQGHQ